MPQITIKEENYPARTYEVVTEWPTTSFPEPRYYAMHFDRVLPEHRLGLIPLCQFDSNDNIIEDTLKVLYVGNPELCEKVDEHAGYYTINKTRFERLAAGNITGLFND